MVSVCIATYNGEEYIREQLQSILCQLAVNDEVIISDDGSTDNTLAIIREINDDRITVVDGPRHHSPTLNFEKALRHANGDYIFLADQDDVWKPNKVAVCMKWLAEYGCVVNDAEVTDSELNVINPSLFSMLKVKKNKLYNTIWKNGYTGCCMAFSRRVLCAALPFPDNIPMHDIWIGNVAAYKYNVKFINDKLIYFRRHEDAASCNGKGSKFTLWQKIRFRWNTIKNIVYLK